VPWQAGRKAFSDNNHPGNERSKETRGLEVIRQSLRRRPTLSLLLAVIGVLGTYALLRGASGASNVAQNTVTVSTPAPAPVSAAISQSPAPQKSVPQLPISNSRERKNPEIPKQPAAKLVLTRALVSSAHSNSNATNRKLNPFGLKGASFAARPTGPITLRKALPSKLRAAPAPQGVQPPNAPVLFGPSNNAAGVSIPPTLDVSVSDPAGSNLSVTFFGRVATAPGPDFTLIALPDTQYYSASLNGGLPAMFNSQTQWIVNNRVADNIVFVTGLGDIVQDGNNNGNFSEWVNADAAVSLLDDPVTTGLPQGIPYSFGVGNHDQGPSGDGSPDDTAGYNQYFGSSRYSGKSYYGGHFGTDNDNHYELFSASGMDFILINIAYMDPQFDGAELNSVLAWANNLLQTNSTRRGILVSHYLINDGLNASWSNQGLATYNALKGNPNLFLMLAGHFTPPEGQRTDTNNGNTIYTLLSDYQEQGNGGNGYLRIMKFSPSNNLISVTSYSPYVNSFRTGSLSQFTLPYNMQNAGYVALGTVSNVPSGSQASMVWNGLSTGTQYQWYVVVSNGTASTTGPTWDFTTGSVATPTVTLSSSNLAFGNQQINTTSTAQTVTLTNTGTAALNLTSIAASTKYAQTNTCGSSVAAGANCTISVTFTPTATGSRPGTITITDNATGSPQTVNLTGTGVAPSASFLPTSLAFGNQNVNTTSAAQTVTLTNGGTATLNVTSIAASTKYAQTNTCGSSVAAGANCTISVTFTPTATGSQPGTITITDNATGSPQTVALTGTGVASSVSFLPTSLTFGNQNVNTISAAQTVTLTNGGGTGALSVTSITTSTQYAETNTCGTSVAAGANCTISVTFTPTATGSRPGTITITDDATGSPQTVNLTGTGTAPVVSLSSTSLSFSSQTVGTTSRSQSVTLRNTGTAALNINSIAASGDFSQMSTCGSSVAAGSSCRISVKFTPTATGTRTGAVTITDNAAGSPHIVSLTGTGK
jgi:hypothetical protein